MTKKKPRLNKRFYEDVIKINIITILFLINLGITDYLVSDLTKASWGWWFWFDWGLASLTLMAMEVFICFFFYVVYQMWTS